MTYDVQRYCFCWICEAMVKWNEPCHEERVTNASYQTWTISADAEAHEKAAVEAAEQRGREHRFAAAHDTVDGDGTVRIVYGDDCPQVLVSRELLDTIVADFNMRRDWFSPAENRLDIQHAERSGREQAIRDCITALTALGHPECRDEDQPQCDWCAMEPDAIAALQALLEGEK